MSEVLSLDTDMAIASMGDKDVYLSILKKFIPNRGETVQSIREALAVADLNNAKRLAHTLKGIAATIGANPLAESARQLELALRQDMGEEYAQLLESMAAEMGVVSARISDYLKAQEASPEWKTQSAELSSLITQLTLQLEDFDSAAADTIRNIRQQLQGTDLEKRFEQLNTCISAYDFENALKEIQSLSKE